LFGKRVHAARVKGPALGAPPSRLTLLWLSLRNALRLNIASSQRRPNSPRTVVFLALIRAGGRYTTPLSVLAIVTVSILVATPARPGEFPKSLRGVMRYWSVHRARGQRPFSFSPGPPGAKPAAQPSGRTPGSFSWARIGPAPSSVRLWVNGGHQTSPPKSLIVRRSAAGT